MVLGSINLVDCIGVNLLTPYVVSMVSDFLDVESDNDKVTYYVGLIVGLYSLCKFIFSPFWGSMSDRFGRKPVLLLGLLGSAIAPIVLGLGTNLTTIFVARALDGFFCGNVGVTRTYLGEVVDESNEAKSFGILSMCYSLGLLIGPILGGYLVYPARSAPSIFGDTIFESFPFLLPNLIYSLFALLSWTVAAICLKETLPKHERTGCCNRMRKAKMPPRMQTQASQRTVKSLARLQTLRTLSGSTLSAPEVFVELEESDSSDSSRSPDVEQPSSTISSSLDSSENEGSGTVSPITPNESRKPTLGYLALFQVIAALCAVSSFFSGATQLLILLLTMPQSMHGYALGPKEIGVLQNFSAAVLLVWQLFLYGPLVKRFGLTAVFCFGWACTVLAQGLFPVYNIWYSEDNGLWRFVPLCFMQALTSIGGGSCYPTAFALINRAAAGLPRGTVNGWSSSGTGLCRTLIPPAVSLLLTWGQYINRGWGRYVSVYIVILSTTFVAVFALPGIRKVGSAGIPSATAGK